MEGTLVESGRSRSSERERSKPLVALGLTLALLAFRFCMRPGQTTFCQTLISSLVVQLTAALGMIIIIMMLMVLQMMKYCN